MSVREEDDQNKKNERKEDKLIRRMSEQDRFKTAMAIQTGLAQN